MYEEVFMGMNYTNEQIAKMFDKTFLDDLDFSNQEVVVVKAGIPKRFSGL